MEALVEQYSALASASLESLNAAVASGLASASAALSAGAARAAELAPVAADGARARAAEWAGATSRIASKAVPRLVAALAAAKTKTELLLPSEGLLAKHAPAIALAFVALLALNFVLDILCPRKAVSGAAARVDAAARTPAPVRAAPGGSPVSR